MSAGFRHLCLAAAVSCLCCHWCAAQVHVTFPLQGYYRPGKYMPVRVTTSARISAPIVLRAEGAVAVSVEPGPAAMNLVVPWLAGDVVRSPRWEVAGVGKGPVDAPLTPLEAQQVLVGVVGADVGAARAAAAELFPGRSVIALPLPGTPAMSGDPAAWEALDAVVFADSEHVFLAELLEQGVSVVIRSEARPGGRWAWQGGPGSWFVRFDVAGPLGAIHPEVYAPVSAWRPGWPAPLRRRAALLAVVYCIVALAATLWRRTRRAMVVVVVASVAATAGFVWWGGRQPMVCDVSTRVEISDTTGTQSDRWLYYRPLRRSDVTVDWPWSKKPVFATARHLRDSDLRLHVGAGGRPSRFTWRAEPGTTLAFLGRRFDVSLGDAGPAAPALPSSPTRELVLRSYLAPGDTILKDPYNGTPYADDADWSVSWPTVTVRRANP